MAKDVEDLSAWRSRRGGRAWWLRWPRQSLTLGSLLLSLACWGVILPAMGII